MPAEAPPVIAGQERKIVLKVNQIKCSIPHTQEQLIQAICKKCKCRAEQIEDVQILKHSIDARKKPVLFDLYTVALQTREEDKILSRCAADRDISRFLKKPYQFHVTGNQKCPERPVIIGAGPAGLFCAYELAMAGFRPLILERGRNVDQRTQDVEKFWEQGDFLPASNVQFGEGGAGTFSDGKLNTAVKDPCGRNLHVLETFVKFGAKEEILYEQKPHLGTDLLKEIVKKMRQAIEALGGEIRFGAQVTDFTFSEQGLTSLTINETENLPCHVAVLAIGHSARDTFQTLWERKLQMEPKSFAVGYRVVHPQTFINHSQYGTEQAEELGAAPYKVTAQSQDGRGVYSFCMCPGGYVVNASSEENRTAVNGMSYSGRDGKCANSAIIVSVSPKDYPDQSPLGGIAFQRQLEENAFAAGKGAIPVEKYGNFVKDLQKSGMIQGKRSVSELVKPFAPDLKGKQAETSLAQIMPPSLQQAFVEGMEQIDLHQIHGFASSEVWLCGIESRTSSPVRIPRDDSFQSSVKGLYPCGEGAGYAGGITSAAMDGMKVAEQIASVYQIL